MTATSISSALFFGFLFCSAVQALENPLRFQQIRTLQNDTFHQVELIKSDATGAYIRHSRGLARIPFADFPADVRAKLELEVMPSNPLQEPDFAEPAAQKNPTNNQDWIVIRTFNPPPATSAYGCPNLLTNDSGVLPYPQSLAIYPCRKLAELDFLYVTGILRRPPGVKIHRLWATQF
tara:strand:+ start:4275 stop:4808 length:534 start_codon:yes stop_codon:yes gene_type:complete